MTKDTNKLVQDITNYLNTFNSRDKEFCLSMSLEHRTLQQSFTRLCLQWVEYCASDEYATDARNEGSKDVAKKIMKLWRKEMILDGFNGSTLEVIEKPSSWIRHI